MLKEIKSAEQKGEGITRKWYEDGCFDLIIWYRDDGSVSGFQLCYDKAGNEHAVSWQDGKGAVHKRIDGGEDTPLRNRAPIEVPDGIFPFEYVYGRFSESSAGLEPGTRELILGLLKNIK